MMRVMRRATELAATGCPDTYTKQWGRYMYVCTYIAVLRLF